MRNEQEIAGDVELKLALDLLQSCCNITRSSINVCETNGLLID